MRLPDIRSATAVMWFLIMLPTRPAHADDTFNKLFSEKKFREAIEYADEKIAPTDRDAMTWIKIGEANNALGMHEKALACFLVSWRMNPNDYNALLGAARAYNRMAQYDNTITMAQKALALNFTAEASWEYAQACIALGRPAEAKKAMEKVLQSDSSNVIAARELSNIYFNEGAWSAAVPLLKRSFLKNASGELAFQIGKAYTELGVPDSAIAYLKKAQAQGGSVLPVNMMLARAFFTRKNYSESAGAYRVVPADSLTAKDLYQYGFALEKTQGISAAASYYMRAVDRFGQSSVVPEALLAREKVVRANLLQKAYREALGQLQPIVAADPKGMTVPEGYFLLAEAYQGLKDTKNAISSLEKAIEVNSRNVEAYARLADLYQGGGNSEKARKTFEVLMGLSPDDPHIYLALGRYNLKSKRFSEALQQFEKSGKLKKSAAAQEGIAQAAFELKRYDRSRSAAEAALKMDGKLHEARLVLALVNLQEKKYAAAQEQFEKLLQQDPDNIDLLTNLANCYEKNGLKDKLSFVDKKIAQMNGSNTESRLRLARYFESNDFSGEAMRYYRELLALTPKSTEVLKHLSLLARKKGDVADAVSYTRQYLTLKGDDAEAHRDLGDLYYEQKNIDGALAEYRLALKLDPAIKGFYKRYAEIVIAKGEQNEVIKALTGVVAAGSADLSTYMTLGLMYQKKKEYIEAIEMYQKALELEPSNFDALTALASCQAANGEVGNAIVSYEQAIMMNAKTVDELKELGNLYLRGMRTDEAYNLYRQFLAKDSSDQVLAAKVGAYLYGKSDYAGAVRYYKIAVKLLSPEDAVNYADACNRTGNNSNILAVLLPLKSNKTIKGTMRRNIFKLIAQAFENDSNMAAAAQAYRDYLNLPGVYDPDAAFKQASLLEKKDPMNAQKIYEKNIVRYPSDYRNFLRLGLMYSERKELLPKAVPLFRRVTELADSIPSVWLELGKIYGKMGNDDEELKAYRRYAEIDPQNIEANRRMGTILMRKDQYNEGIVFLEIANTLQPNDPEVMPVLAKGYVKTGRTEEAVALLNKAKEKKNDDPEIRFQLFELYQKSGQREKAQKEIEALISIKRDNRYMLLYAEALTMQGKEKDAAGVVEEILATDPENIPVLMLKAKIQRSLKQYDEAIETYKEISFIKPDHAPSILERAETHMEQSKPQWAESFYKRALRADPSLGRAELGLAKIAKLRKDIAGYQEHLENARRLSPDDEAIREELGKSER
ncbi:MAG: tetratricopeptide repeat protein [Chitinispirillaceae bacterium]|nr:tetratricopeptide repeat protein [Chitinispirillaceae bacterium]